MKSSFPMFRTVARYAAFAAAALIPQISSAAFLWTVSTGGLVSSGTLDGQGSPIWRTIHAPSTAPGAAISATDILDNSDANPIAFTVTSGTVSEFGGRFAWNTASNPGAFDFEISGLAPGAEYSMYAYGAGFGTRDFNLTIDQDGNGTLDILDPVVNVFSTSNGSVITNIVADSTGTIIGRAANAENDEANWTAFQLVQTSAAAPEPMGLVLTSAGLAAIAFLRRRKAAAR